MPTPPLARHLAEEAAQVYREHGYNMTHAAHALNMPRGTLQKRLASAKKQGIPVGASVVVESAPDTEEPLEDLIARKRAGMERTKAGEEWGKLIPVQVKDRKPIGVFFVGDPHLDDDHCDIAQLEHDLTTVGRTDGFMAGHVGDLTNNWVGRLARLYAHQSTTFRDGVRLVEWMLGLCPNLFVVNGNHDLWNNGGDLLRFIVRAGAHQSHGARLSLRWPGGQELRIHARHDFAGKSQFSDTHGMRRELLWGHRDHILVAGHIHADEARVVPSVDGDAHWLFRVSGYKVVDDFAKERGYRTKRLASGVSVVLDPAAAVPAERIKPFWDVEAAADYLSWRRSK